MPLTRNRHACAVTHALARGTEIVVAGGVLAGLNEKLADVHVFSFRRGQWLTKAGGA